MFMITAYYFEHIEEFCTITETDLWNWFLLRQSSDATILKKSNRLIYIWSHISEKMPFVYDEWCPTLSNLLYENNLSWTEWKQLVWEILSLEDQKKCIRDNNNKKISVLKISERFYVVSKQEYESSTRFLYDSQKKVVYNNLWISLQEIVKIETWTSGFFIQYRWARWNEWWVLFMENEGVKSKILFSNTDESLNSNTFVEILDFELQINKQILVRYKWQNWEIKEKIVSIY